MKKVLLASTFLALSATVVAADGLNLSGYGRFGLDYNSDPAGVTTPNSQINMRMRVNIDGSKATDSGVTFGGRIRLQYTDGDTAASLSPAQLYATYEGLRVEVGNASGAFDSAALMYNSELGYLDRSFGGPNGAYFSFSSGAYAPDRMGIYASYAIAGFNIKASYIDPNQTNTTTDPETAIAVDYTTGQFTVSAAFANDAAGVDGNKMSFFGAEYAISEAANVGLLYSNDNPAVGVDETRVTLYGNYTTGAMTFEGYVADDDTVGNLTDTAFGLGVNYDLGGARLGADIHRNYAEQTIVGLGVRFDF